MAATVRRDVYRCTITPPHGSDTNDPTAIANNTTPTCAGLRCKLARICGIRDVQLADTAPTLTNAAAVARAAARQRTPFTSDAVPAEVTSGPPDDQMHPTTPVKCRPTHSGDGRASTAFSQQINPKPPTGDSLRPQVDLNVHAVSGGTTIAPG